MNIFQMQKGMTMTEAEDIAISIQSEDENKRVTKNWGKKWVKKQRSKMHNNQQEMFKAAEQILGEDCFYQIVKRLEVKIYDEYGQSGWLDISNGQTIEILTQEQVLLKLKQWNFIE